MVSPQESRDCRFTVHYTGNFSVLPRVLDVLSRFAIEPAWLFTRIKPKGAFRLDVRFADICDQRADVIAARLKNLMGVTKVSYDIKDGKAPPDKRPGSV